MGKRGPKKGAEYKRRKPLRPESELKRPRETKNAVLHPAHFKALEYLFQGMSKKDALIRAGYSESYASHRQSAVFNRPDVLAAMIERQEKMSGRTDKIIDRIQDELAKIAFFNIGEILQITDEGEFVFDFSTATMDEFAAIGEVTVEEYKDGRGRDAQTVKRVKVKPYDKKAALDSLARIHGLFQDNVNINDGGMSLEERLTRGRERVAKGLPKPGSPSVTDAEYTEVRRMG